MAAEILTTRMVEPGVKTVESNTYPHLLKTNVVMDNGANRMSSEQEMVGVYTQAKNFNCFTSY